MDPENYKAGELIFKPIKTLGRGDNSCRFIPIGRRYHYGEGDLTFRTKKLFTFGARKNEGYKGAYPNYSLPLCLWDEKKDSKDTIKNKKVLLNTLEVIGKECENYLKKERIKHNMNNTKNNCMLSCLFNPDKELSPILYANIDQDKKGNLSAYLEETKGKTNEQITTCEYLTDSRWKVRAVLKITGICLTEKYTSLKIKVLAGIFRAYTRPAATHFFEQEILSDSEDEDDIEYPEGGEDDAY